MLINIGEIGMIGYMASASPATDWPEYGRAATILHHTKAVNLSARKI